MSEKPIFSVALTIHGDSLIPVELTKVLGATPTRTRIKGDVISSPHSDRTGIAKTGLWNLDSSLSVESDDPLEHLNFILSQVTYDMGRITDIDGVDSARIYIGAFSGEENETALEFEIPHETLKRICDLGLYFHFVFS